MTIDGYLQRIGGSAGVPDYPTLAALMAAHQQAVVFENLDVQLGKPLTTSIEEAYEKIVHQKRGGWCYEQNGVFGWALSELGFNVQRISAAVMRQRSGPSSHANHLALLVQLPDQGGRWLVDVGFGGSLLTPIPLATGIHHHPPFEVGLRQLDDGYWQFWERLARAETSRELTFDFEDLPADESGMSQRCRFLQTDPESGFFLNLVCQRRYPDAHATLRGRVLTRTSAKDKHERLLTSAADLVETLRHQFQLDVPAAASLWPKICQRHLDITA